MALNLSALNLDFYNIFTFPSHDNTEKFTAAYCATVWINAYDRYARQATDGLGNSVTGMNFEGFKAQLNYAFSRSRWGANVIPDITTAVNVYWTGVTLEVNNLPPGGVSPITNVVNSTPNNISFATGLTTDISTGAQRVSNAFHNKTTVVTTLFTYIHAGTPPYLATYNSTLT